MQQALTRLRRRQKIPLSCHNNPNLFEDGATLARTREKREEGERKKEHRKGSILPGVSDKCCHLTGLAVMFLSNGLIAQLILRPARCRPPFNVETALFSPRLV